MKIGNGEHVLILCFLMLDPCFGQIGSAYFKASLSLLGYLCSAELYNCVFFFLCVLQTSISISEEFKCVRNPRSSLNGICN